MKKINKALHTKSIWRSNLISDIRIAKEAGFAGLEMAGTKVWDYIQADCPIDHVKATLAAHDMQIISINDIAHIERTDDDSIQRMLKETHTLSSFAQQIGCHCIQLVPLCALAGRSWEEIRDLTAKNIRRIAMIGKEYDVRFQLEPVAWSPINSLPKAKELIQAVDCDNFGTVIDFWHLWYGRGTTVNDIATCPKEWIYNIHFCDGFRDDDPEKCDETVLRGVYAGEGEIPLHDFVNAVKETGYDGWWAYELVSKTHWEMDTQVVARQTSELLDQYVFQKA